MTIELRQGDALAELSRLPDNSIDLTVTSPPYDSMRTYNGYSFDFESIAKQLVRVTKRGGVIVWVVNDSTSEGSESLSSFSQALHFKSLGMNVETMIWEKTGSGALGSNYFYGQNFEYMFVLSKGFPKHGELICDRENIVKNGTVKVNGSIGTNGKGVSRTIERKPYGKRSNIWRIDPQKNSGHPAPFPETLARDHILSWSNRGDTVLDPMCGSGTTGVESVRNGRNFIGFDISAEYIYGIAKERIEKELTVDPKYMRECGSTLPQIAAVLNLSVPAVARLLK